MTALLRAPEQSGALVAGVRIVAGDVLDGGLVSDAVDGEDAVIVTLRPARTKAEPAVAALGTLNMIRSMQRCSVRRLIVRSTVGMQPGRDPNLPWHVERLVKPLLRRAAYDDLRRMETSVRQSELDWTIVRAPGAVGDGPARGIYRSAPGYSLPGGRSIARADLTEHLLDQLTLTGDIGHAVAVAY